ncbi:MAG TPA: hypothetical protein VF636_09170, partial [Sphingomonas sp.]
MAIAVPLALLLSTAWAANDWPDLSRLVLPDTDDMVRLAQVRDWLAGQAANDWTQSRMGGRAGAPMHWSRLNDLGPAAIIAAAQPFSGRYGAELLAVLLYPALLFAASLFLSARIAGRLWSPRAGVVAIAVAALAFPGTTIFAPGRIDHHALQAVLVQLALLAITRAPSRASGVGAGTAMAVSLATGLEATPQIAALILTLAGLWAWRGEQERGRLGALAAALGGTTAAFLLVMRPTLWSAAYCDAFTPASTTGTLLGAAALGLLALATTGLPGPRARLACGAALGAAALGATLLLYPACLDGPYGVAHPLIRAEFLSRVDEVRGLLDHRPIQRAMGLGGLLLVACAAAAWMVARRPARRPITLPAAAALAMSALVALVQSRGVYLGAPLAAPVLAGLILAARRRGAWRGPALAGVWIASAGVCHQALPDAIARLAAPA